MKFLKDLLNERWRETEKERFKREEMEHELGHETKYDDSHRAPHYRRGGRQPWNTPEKDRTYLNVPFAEKDEAKKMGAKWDGDKKKWYHAKGKTDDKAKVKWKA